MTKKLLFVTTRLPWPTTSGRKESLYHYCRLLATHYGYEVSLFVFPEAGDNTAKEHRPDFIKSVHFAHHPGLFSKCLSLFLALFKKKTPFQCALFYSRKNKKALRKLVKDIHPDVLLFDMIRAAPYLKDYVGKIRTVLDLDDLLSVRYARQLSAFDPNVSIAGKYGEGMSNFARRLLCHGKIAKRILRAEAGRVARAEILYGGLADGVILVSEKEASLLQEKLPHTPVVTVPVGVNVADFTPTAPALKSPFVIGFLGNMSVAANALTLREIAALLPNLPPKTVLEVAGHCPDALKAELEGPQIRFLGTVKDLAPVLTKWPCMLAPLPFGSGIKTKILTAMAAGVAVVTNPVGAEGIEAVNGQDFFVCENKHELLKKTAELLENTELALAVGENARLFVKNHFDWDVISREFKKLEF